MVKTILLFALLIVCLTVKSQNSEQHKVELMQGIWEGIMNSDAESLYKIVKGNKSLGIVFTTAPQASDFYLNESIEGFQNYKRSEIDSINVKWLGETGKYYTQIIDKDRIKSDGWVSTKYCVTPEYFECNGKLMSINGGHLSEYEKISELPFNAMVMLYKRGKLDKRDYIKEYIEADASEIRTSKSKVYANPNKQSNVQLKKGDVVIVIEKTGKWLKIKYSEEGMGWIKNDEIK